VELSARIEKYGSTVNQYAALIDTDVGRHLEKRVETVANIVGDHYSKMKALLSDLEAPVRRVREGTPSKKLISGSSKSIVNILIF
jgi:hypothetical protein